ncbi:hypothetical protein [Streptomyces sp. NPDC001781]
MHAHFTTPPRPFDVTALFPELAPLARTATRLHPRPGAPTVRDSSVGGLLLWPVGEPWPHCDEPHDRHAAPVVHSPDDVRLVRRDRAAAAERRRLDPESMRSGGPAVARAGTAFILRPRAGLPAACSTAAVMTTALTARLPAGLEFIEQPAEMLATHTTERRTDKAARAHS